MVINGKPCLFDIRSRTLENREPAESAGIDDVELHREIHGNTATKRKPPGRSATPSPCIWPRRWCGRLWSRSYNPRQLAGQEKSKLTTGNPIMTIGHSNHPVDRFLELLHHHRVQTVIDVRTTPASRYVPHFNRNHIDRTLADANIGYFFVGAMLGGRPDLLALYTLEGRADCRSMAMTTALAQGIGMVAAECLKSTIAIICSEKAPDACHRTLLVEHHLHNVGRDVRHIIPGQPDPEPSGRHPDGSDNPSMNSRPGSFPSSRGAIFSLPDRLPAPRMT